MNTSGKKDSSVKNASEAAKLMQPWRRKSETAPNSTRKKKAIMEEERKTSSVTRQLKRKWEDNRNVIGSGASPNDHDE